MRASIVLGIVLLCSFSGLSCALKNGVGKTPAMGWNSWNYFRCNINETIIRSVPRGWVRSLVCVCMKMVRARAVASGVEGGRGQRDVGDTH